MGSGRDRKIAEVLGSCRIGGRPLYFIGTFESGVTVLSQQVRALNLVWALVESELVDCDPTSNSQKPLRIAIVGAGFAGITTAAALIAKKAWAEITLLEERDALLPLQLGSDNRWLHPRIYDWPGDRSESSAAMIPILNWTAARASDVTVQILAEWKQVAGRQKNLFLYCNTKHLQIQELAGDANQLRIEWMGEERNPADGTMSSDRVSVGKSESFDLVVLATGYGLERDGATSYWRNEVIGQPALDKPRQTYLVSGQGDGAFIDLLRIKISQYRQDRILDELFSGKAELKVALKALHRRFAIKHNPPNMFRLFEKLAACSGVDGKQFRTACEQLRHRLRRDTEVVLRTREPPFEKLFNPMYARSSFQNKLLVYMLYKCGAFIPSARPEDVLILEHSISRDCIIRRHGTETIAMFRRVLSRPVLKSLLARQRKSPISLSDEPRWKGGYFGYRGRSARAAYLPDEEKKSWRKEYLPGPTALVASAFCATLAGELARYHPKDKRLRVALHRAFSLGPEEVLQQACEYQGLALESEPRMGAGRTFPARNATIGLAYSCRQIIRSKRDVSPQLLQQAMKALNLTEASSRMAADVTFVLAVPLLEPERDYTFPAPVSAVIYIDSKAQGYCIDDERLSEIVAMAHSFLSSMTSTRKLFGGIRNISLSSVSNSKASQATIPMKVRRALEAVPHISPPRSAIPFEFNFDHSDFVPTE
jgi:hypothetical protein